MKSVIILAVLVAIVNADLYMHNPRGSNDRLNEAGTNRDNGNRLFDSQNNAKGGYCVGPAMSFYEGSLVSIEWTNQHGCGQNPKLRCNMVFQYTCGSNKAELADGLSMIRDGTTTTTIPDDPSSATNGAAGTDANGNYLYGMHESYDSYQACKTRQRNMGLWISDREQEGGLNQGRKSAIFTRQNNNGDRNGFECAEERDYYPYWHPTIWRDIAILAMDESHCSFFEKESQNVKYKNWCANKDGSYATANNEQACNASGGDWKSQDPWKIPAPTCLMSDWSRDNHLGNGMGGYPNMFNWTLPTTHHEKCIKDNSCNCVLRIRYNISSWDLESGNPNGNAPDKAFLDWTYNENNSPVKDDQLAEQANFTNQLALDTTQFGRTFQDRSHVFHIKPRPDGVSPVARIFNLNVRGKRGNIVQAYPAVEYDFVPEALYVRRFDYIHFQWTGCDTNPQGNAGEGTDQTDRNNIVQIANIGANKPATDDWFNNHKALFESEELRYYMASLGQTNCLTYDELVAKHPNNENAQETDTQNCMKLNSMSTGYFDGGLIRMNQTGTFYYMSSRNNNFTNRGQKGAIMVQELLPIWGIVLVVVGCFVFLLASGLGVAMLYARSHPHSSIANLVNKF